MHALPVELLPFLVPCPIEGAVVPLPERRIWIVMIALFYDSPSEALRKTLVYLPDVAKNKL